MNNCFECQRMIENCGRQDLMLARAQTALQNAASLGTPEEYAKARTALSDAYIDASVAHFALTAHIRLHYDAAQQLEASQLSP